MKIKGLRWWIVSLVAIATVINYIDRQALGILWPEISKDLGLGDDSKTIYANIAFFFTIAYAISKGLSGRIFDVIGTRLGFVASIVIWSLAAMLHAIATTAASFTLFRVLLGLGEAGNWPGATKSNAEWFPTKDRALAQGIFNSGASMGAIISAPLIAALFVWIGWQGTFILIGAIGFLWIVPWLFFNRGIPQMNVLLTDEEKAYILNDSAAEKVDDQPGLGWSGILKFKQSWSVIIQRFFFDPIWWFFVLWLPLYLNEKFGFNVKEIGAFAWIPYVGAAIGSIAGGWMARRLINNGWNTNRTRKSVILGGGILMLIGMIASSQASDPTVAMLLIALILFGFQIAIGNVQTLPSDYFSNKSVGTLAGLGGTAAALGTILFSTVLIPMISKDSYDLVFLLGAALAPFGLAALFLLGGEIKRVDNPEILDSSFTK